MSDGLISCARKNTERFASIIARGLKWKAVNEENEKNELLNRMHFDYPFKGCFRRFKYMLDAWKRS